VRRRRPHARTTERWHASVKRIGKVATLQSIPNYPSTSVRFRADLVTPVFSAPYSPESALDARLDQVPPHVGGETRPNTVPDTFFWPSVPDTFFWPFKNSRQRVS